MASTPHTPPKVHFWEVQTTRRALMAVVSPLFFVATGLFAAWIASKILTEETHKLDGTTAVALLVTPVLVYAIVSGKLSQLKAGGLEATFVEAAKQKPDFGLQHIDVESEEQILTKENVDKIATLLEKIDEDDPIILNLTHDPAHKYSADFLKQYLQAFLRYRTFKYVTVTNGASKVVAFAPAWRLLEILSSERHDEELERILAAGKTAELKYHPAFSTSTLPMTSTYVDALRKMTTENVDAIVLTDGDGRPKGVLEREHLLAKLMLAMAS